MTKPGKGRKIRGYLLTRQEDGRTKWVDTIVEARAYIDQYEGAP